VSTRYKGDRNQDCVTQIDRTGVVLTKARKEGERNLERSGRENPSGGFLNRENDTGHEITVKCVIRKKMKEGEQVGPRPSHLWTSVKKEKWVLSKVVEGGSSHQLQGEIDRSLSVREHTGQNQSKGESRVAREGAVGGKKTCGGSWPNSWGGRYKRGGEQKRKKGSVP